VVRSSTSASRQARFLASTRRDHAQVTERTRSRLRLRPALPRDLEVICLKCWKKSPANATPRPSRSRRSPAFPRWRADPSSPVSASGGPGVGPSDGQVRPSCSFWPWSSGRVCLVDRPVVAAEKAGTEAGSVRGGQARSPKRRTQQDRAEEITGWPGPPWRLRRLHADPRLQRGTWKTSSATPAVGANFYSSSRPSAARI